MTAKTVQVPILTNGSLCAIPVPFDPKVVFGKVRAPVRVTLNGYTFRSTIARMRGETFIPLRKSHREAAGVEAGQRLKVRIEADTEERIVEVPEDLAEALKAAPGAWERWGALSYTHQRENVESVLDAKQPETRARRIARVVKRVSARRS